MSNPEKLATYGRQDEEKQNIICIGHHDAQKNTNNVNMTTGDELNIIFMWKS